MTNIVFSSDIVRDDSSSVTDSTEGSLLEENDGVPERGIHNRFEAKRVFSAIGKVYSSITRSVFFPGSSSVVKIENSSVIEVGNVPGSLSVMKTETSGIEVGKDGQILDDEMEEKRKYSRFRGNPRPGNVPNHVDAELVAAGWPSWLILDAGEAIMGWVPRRADSFEKIAKIGQGKHSHVFKCRDSLTGKIVALKKVRFDNLEPESVKFMAREIVVLRRLDHPNVIKLEGLVTTRMSVSLYLVFEYIEHDLAGMAANTNIKLTEPQIKCYMRQLLLGLEHCHNRQVLHRDLKSSDLRLDNGVLKVADFGLASFFDPYHKYPMTSRVVSLCYRPLELLLGATEYGVAVDLWSVGCILAEL